MLRPESPFPVDLPLRVLAMTARPADQDELAVDQEQGMLRGALAPLEQTGQLELAWWVEEQSWRSLRDAISGGGPWLAD